MPCENVGVFFDHIQDMLEKTAQLKVYPSLLSKYITLAFPNVKSERRRWSDTGERQTLIHGIHWRNAANDIPLDNSVTVQMFGNALPEGIIIIKLSDDFMMFGYEIEDFLCKVTIHYSGKVEFMLKGTVFFNMQLELITMSSIVAILESVKTIKLCHGVQYNDK